MSAKTYPPLSRNPLDFIGKECAARFSDSTGGGLVLGFGKGGANELVGNFFGHEPVEAPRVPITADLKHLDYETPDSNFILG